MFRFTIWNQPLTRVPYAEARDAWVQHRYPGVLRWRKQLSVDDFLDPRQNVQPLPKSSD
jgi:hypothetical protein